MSSNHIEFNKAGDPLFAIGGSVIISTTGVNGRKKRTVVDKGTTPASVDSSRDSDFLTKNNILYAPWFGPNNDYPEIAKGYIQKSPVLCSGIDYKSRLAIGQGLYAVRIKDIDEAGNEVLEVIKDPFVNKFLRSRFVRKSIAEAYYSIYSFGMGFPQVVLSSGNSSPVLIKVQKSHQCRLSKFNSDGFSDVVGLSSDWASTSEEVQKLTAINTMLPIDQQIEAAKKVKNFVFPLGLPSPVNSYYSDAPWANAQRSGHLDISLKIATYLDKMFDNQMSIKYHIKIPYAYWDKKYPKINYPTPADEVKRMALIQADIDKVIENFTKAENAQKAIVTHFEINQQGKAEEQWQIDVIDDKFKNDQYLPHAASSNSEIYTSMGINPVIRGMSQAAGPYANNQGGSNIREAFAVDVALSWVDTQEVVDFVELLLALQFPTLTDLQIRTRQTILTTLDTGQSSKSISQ